MAPTGGHNIYVAENGGAISGLTGADDRVSYFDPTGTYLGTWGNSGSGNGSFADPQGIAVDSTGDVYVADTGNNRVQKFTSSGGWLASWDSTMGIDNPLEIAVDASDKVWVVDGASVSRYSGGGALLTSWLSGGATGVDIDSDGNVWVMSTAGVVREYDVTGVLLATLGAGQLSARARSRRRVERGVRRGHGQRTGCAFRAPHRIDIVVGAFRDRPGHRWFIAIHRRRHRRQHLQPLRHPGNHLGLQRRLQHDGRRVRQRVGVLGRRRRGARIRPDRRAARNDRSGYLSSPHGISVATATGKLLVADTGNIGSRGS